MARARPTQRPASDDDTGKLLRSQHDECQDEDDQNLGEPAFKQIDALRLCLRVALLRGFRELGVRAFGADLLQGALSLPLALVHGFLEAAYGLPEIRADRAQLLRTEHNKHHEQYDYQLANS